MDQSDNHQLLVCATFVVPLSESALSYRLDTLSINLSKANIAWHVIQALLESDSGSLPISAYHTIVLIRVDGLSDASSVDDAWITSFIRDVESTAGYGSRPLLVLLCPSRSSGNNALQSLICRNLKVSLEGAGQTTILNLTGEQHLSPILQPTSIEPQQSSNEQFVNELFATLGNICSNSASLSVDRAEWQHEWLEHTSLVRDFSFWQHELADAPPLLELPTDRPRPAVQCFEGRLLEFTLSKNIVERLLALGSEHDAELYIVLLSAFKVLLSRYSGKEDIVVGTSLAHHQNHTDPLIFDNINALVSRTEVVGELSFIDLLGRVRSKMLACCQHQKIPFEKLVAELQSVRSPSYSPFFQVKFQLQTEPASSNLALLSTVSDHSQLEASVKLDLTLDMYPSGEGLSGSLTYNKELFDAATIERMADHFEVLLEGIVAQPETPIAQLPLLTESERRQVVLEWNDTARDYDLARCIHHLFEDQVDQTPDALALVFEGQELSYAELNAQSNQLAHYLIGQGVGRDVCVGVCMDRSLEMVVSLYAILKAGGAFVPLDPDYPSERLGFMLEDAQVPMLLVQAHLLTTFPDYPGTLFSVDSQWSALSGESTENPLVEIDPAQLAYVIFTSGSTGRPKGAMNSHQGIGSRLLFMQEQYPLYAADALLQKTPFSFDPCVWEFFWPLFIGAKLVVPRPQGHKDPDYLVELIIEHGVSVLEFVPSMLQVFLEARRVRECVSLRHVFSSGEVLPYELQGRFFDCFSEAKLYNTYGPSEAAIDISYWECERGSVDVNVPIGRPVANTQLYVLDRLLQPQPVGVPGELHIGGVQVGQGYVGRPDLTEAVFIADPYRDAADARLYKTGDLARFRPDGAIEFLGRIDTQVKLRGFRIELGEIETIVLGHSAVSDAVVVVNGEGVDQQLAVYFVANEAQESDSQKNEPVDSEQLREHIATHLPEYMVPALYMALDAIPQLPNGKVDRRSLPKPDRGQLVGAEYVAPESETEKALAAIWSSLLDVEQVGLHDDFFALGGHSLKAVQVVSRMRSQLSLEVPLRWLFESPTVAEIAARVEATEVASSSELPLVPIARDGALVLSYAQERLWFLDQLEGASALYNISFALRLVGVLNETVLEQALQQIVERHEVLRTRIVVGEQGEPEQQISNASLEISHEMIEGSPQSNEAALELLVKGEAGQSFELSEDLKIRARLVKICSSGKNDFHTLILTMHHIASDGWSELVFSQELNALYKAGIDGEEISLPALAVQYADYAVWQRAWLNESRLGIQLEYWSKQLSGAPPLLELPMDRPRPAVQRFDGHTYEFVLPETMTNQLRTLGSDRGATFYMTLLAAFTVLLSRYSGEEDVVVGSPIANRQQEEIESLIGFFVNTLVLRTDVSAELTFNELLDGVRETTLSAYQHQDVPFEKLVEELQPARSLSYSPLFQVLFQLQNMPGADLSLPGLNVDWIDASEETAKFDLTLGLCEFDGGLNGWLNYNTDLFDESTIERMAGHFKILLEGIIANPETPVSRLPLLEESERRTLVLNNNQSIRSYPSTKTIVDLFVEQALLTPDAIAVEGQVGRHLDYATLNRDSNRLAHYLISSGAVVEGSSKRIGVYLERDVEMLVALLGVLKAGAAYIPLDPLFPPERLALMAEDAQLTVVVTQASLESTVPGDSVNTIVIDRLSETLSELSDSPLAQAGVNDTAYVIYTSGSTGRPKGVSVGHQALTNFLCSMQSEPGLVASDRLLAVTTLSFDIAALELYLPLITGACTILASREETMDPESLVRRLRGSSANVMQATPATWRMLLDSGWSGESGLKVLCGGEALPRELATELLGKNAELWNLYGPTETTIWSTLSRVEPGEGLVSVGRPIANTQVYVLDEGLAVQPVGVSGELYIGGDGVAQGYLDREELTAEKFVLDPFRGDGARMYRTGDRARLRVDGTLEVLGRLDEQVKLRGYRIEPGEIRARLLEFEQISDAVVVVREDVPGEARLVAYLVGSGEQISSEDVLAQVPQLRTQLQSSLPDYMIPMAWVALDALPLTPNGKVDRRSLPLPDQYQLSGTEYVAPESETERALAGIWSELLGVEKVGLHDSFFTYGGHSLKAVQVISRIRIQLSIEVPLRWMFESPSVGEMSLRIDADQRSLRVDQTLPLVPAARGTALVTSYAQERLWFLDQLEGASALYNMTFGLILRGELNETALEQAIQLIVERHEVLRTKIVLDAKGDLQQLVTDTCFELLHDTISGSAQACELSLITLSEEHTSTVFDLSSDLKISARLIKVCIDGEDPYYSLLATMHHIASDGWSLHVFARELGEIYTAICEGKQVSLPALQVQYADYAIWQRTWLDEVRMGEKLLYWRQQLAGALPLLELPTDRPRPAVQRFEGGSHYFILPASLTSKLQALGAENGATLYMTLLSAFTVLLNRYSGEDDIVVGSPIANRQQQEIESLIGFFVNTLVLRTDASGEPNFKDLLRRVRETTLSAYQHQDVPFEKLVEELQPDRSLSYSPLFQVMFELHNMPSSDLALPGLSVELLEDKDETAKCDLTLGLTETGETLSGLLNYNTDLFNAATIERMADHFEVLLEGIVAQPETPIAQLSLLTESERRQVVLEWNDTARDYDLARCIHHLFEDQVDQTPDALALVFEGQELSYAELNAQSNQLAHYLIGQGVGRDVCVGVCMDRSLEMVVSLYAILKAGGAFVPLDPDYPSERLGFMLEDAQVPMLLVQAHLLTTFPDYPGTLFSVDSQWSALSGESTENPLVEIDPAQLAYVIFTSGSTGRPKGAMNSHQGIGSRLLFMQEQYPLYAADALLQKTPFSFDPCVWEFFWPLFIGAKLVVPRPQGHKDPDYLVELIIEHGVSVLEFVPSMLQVFLEARRVRECVSLRHVFSSGEVLPYELQGRFFDCFSEAKLYNTYGPSEAAIDISYWECERGSVDVNVPIGRPVANTQLYVLDRLLQPQPVGVPGELHIGGVQVGQGYVGRPDLTEAVFIADPYREEAEARLYKTGDLARFRPDGAIEFLGRIDTQVKLRGFRIELGEIETIVLGHSAVSDAVVVVNGEGVDQQLAVYFVANEAQESDSQKNEPVDSEQLREHIATHLPEYMVPALYMALDAIPQLPNGKVDRRSLPKPDRGQLVGAEYVAPESETEKALAAIWSSLLDVEQVGLHDDFFALGGHSLKAVQVVSRMRSQLSLEVPLRWLFESPTVAEIAARVEATEVASSSELPLVPIARDGALVLSYAQERLWFLDQLEGASALYNISFVIRLVGELNVNALETALQQIVERHEVLRTRIKLGEGGEAEQQITETRLELLRNTVRGSKESCEASCKVLAAKEASTVFDLSADLKIRALLLEVCVDEEERFHILLLTQHHIASDGWSSAVFERELSALYAAGCEGREALLPDLPVQYADYAIWQRAWLDEARMGEQLAYWQQQLSGAPPLLELPTDRPRPAVQRFEGRTHEFKLPAALTLQLRELSKRTSATLYMTLLSAFTVLLNRYSGEEDIVVGSATANRQREEIESLIGFFVNTLVLRTELSGEVKFIELLEQVRETTLSAYQHQDVPFEKLVEELQPVRSLSYSPLFQVMFQLQNMPESDLSLPGLSVEWQDESEETAKCDLSLDMYESDGGITGWLNYNTDLFDAATIERMADHFEVLLEGIVAQPETPIAQLPLLTESERRQVVLEWNDTARDYDLARCIHHLFEDQVDQTPDALALVFEGQELSYAELNAQSNQLAHYLIGQGVGRDVCVGVCMDRSLEMVVSLYAILKAGGAFVPLDPDYPSERLGFMLEDAQVPMLLVQAHLLTTFPDYPGTLFSVDSQWSALSGESTENPLVEIDPAQLAYVIFTSGSTGRPKGAMNSHQGIGSRLLFMQEQYPLYAADALLQKTPFSFDPCVWEFFWPLFIGAKLVVPRPQGHKDPDYLVELIIEHGVSVLEFVPSMLQVFLEARRVRECVSLRHVFSSGEVLPYELQGRFFDCFSEAKLYNTYGPSEAAIDISYWECERGSVDVNVPIGRPVANTQLYVLDRLLQPQPVGVPGELHIGGVQVGQGYVGRADLTEAVFIADPYRDEADARLYKTGDLARFRPDGAIEFLGRIDTQVKLRGFRIELGEIETIVLGHSAVSDAVVVVNGEGVDQQLAVYFVANEAQKNEAEKSEAEKSDSQKNEPVDSEQLRQHIAAHLPEYMVPALYMALDAIPQLPNGKVDRRSLPKPDRGQLVGAEYVAPESETEKALAAIWSSLLDVEQVGLHDDFFALGGHSLKAVQVVSRMRSQLSLEVPLRWLFESPTVGEIAARVEATEVASSSELPLVPIARDGALVLSYAQERLWFLDQLEGASALYNISFALRLVGVLNETVLEQALQQIVERHEVLRTRIVMGAEGYPEQQIAETRLELSRETLSGSAEYCATSLARLIQEDAAEVFELPEDLKIRACLVNIRPAGETEYYALLVSMHHIASDGWSSDVFEGELSELYAAGCDGREATLSSLPVQYADYAAWQRAWLDEARMGEQLAYWQQQLSGAPPLLELPTDRPRPAVQRFKGETHEFALSQSLSKQLQALGQKRGATLYMTLLSAFAVLLNRYSGEEDIVIGSPIANRQQEEIESLIGFFVNTLILRTNVATELSFNELLERVRETTLSAYQHQDVPFEKLVEELKPVRSLSYSPLFQVMFQLQNMPESALSLSGLSVEWLDDSEETAKFDLSLDMFESDSGITGWLNYNTDLFNAATIERMADHFEVLLEGIVAQPETPIAQLPLLTESERRQVVLEWNDTARDYDLARCIHHLFEDQVDQTPDALALVFEGQELSYAELNAQSNQLAHYLIGQGVGRDVCVGVCMDRSLEMVVSLYAILKAGGAFVPLDPDYPSERLGFMLEDAQVPMLLVQAHLLTTFPDYPGTLFSVDSQWSALSGESTENPLVEIDPAQLAYVIFTSGSTGRPKGAMNSHQGIGSRLLFMQEQYPLYAADALLQKTPFSFDPCVWEFFWPLFIGAKLVVPRPQGHKDPDYLVELIIEHGVSVLEFVPSMLQVFLEARRVRECVSLRHVFSSGEVLPYELQGRFFDCFSEAKLYNTYGPSEAAIDISYWECERGSVDVNVPIGRPVANTQLYVLDRLLQPQPVGVPGELHIGGVQVGQGYVGRADLTEAVFIADPYRDEADARLYKTGDLARFRPDGAIEFLGRIDTQVKLRGFRIELGEIETIVLGHSAVSDAVVVVNGEGVDQQLAVYFVANEAQKNEAEKSEAEKSDSQKNEPVDSEQLRQHIAAHLPEYMVPALYMALDAIPQLPNGKVDRRSLPKPDRGQLVGAEYVAPESETEKALAAIWSSLLDVEQVGLHDDFFALGGHSLKAVQVVSRMRSQLSLEVPLRWLFESPTVGEIAARVEATEVASSSELPLVPIARDGALVLSYAQERLWFLDQLEGASALYNISFALRLVGVLNETVLEQALQQIVERHEVLRTRIVMGAEGYPEQQIAETRLELSRETLSGSAEYCATSLARLIQEDAAEVFELPEDLKIRACLVNIRPAGETEYYALLVSMHHIASDGWSSDVFEGELSELYAAGCDGREATLSSLPVQYADYAAWQRAWLDEARMGEQLAYWQQQLSGAPPLLELPTDRPRPAVQRFKGETHEFALSQSLSKQLQALGQKRGATLYMTLLSAFAVLLNRYSGEEDIVIGSPIANRQQEEIESLIGFFVNTLILRTNVAAELSFNELLECVRETTLSAYQHQDVPFEKLVEELQPVRSLSYSPLFQVMFQLQNMPESDLSLPGLKVDWLDEDDESAKFDLTLGLYESDEELSGWLNYNTALFDESTIKRMAGHFEMLLEGIVANPEIPVSRLPLLEDTERRALLLGYNQSASTYPSTKTVVDLFAEQALLTPDAIALEGQAGRYLDYATLDRDSNRLAHYLLDSGALVEGSSKRIGVYLERDIEMVVALLGVLKAGAAYVPMDPLFPPERLALMSDDARLTVVLTQASLEETVPDKAVSTILIDKLGEALSQSSDAPLAKASIHDTAYVIYTSGSTGRPKGVSVGHQALTNFLCSMQKEPGLVAADRLLAVTTLSFDIAGLELYLPLISGACTILANREESMDPQRLIRRLSESRASVMQATPATWRMLLDSGWSGEPSLKVLCGGEALPRELATELLTKSGELWNLYGPTETTIWSTLSRVEAGSGLVSVGKPIANTQVYVLDAGLAVQPVGVSGELYIGGDGVAQGYLDRAELTAERFVLDPFKGDGSRLYRTGDRARLRVDGTLEVLGRLDEQVKLRGYRIEPGEIRARLVESEQIRDAVVVVREDVPGEAQLVAYLVGSGEQVSNKDVLTLVPQLRSNLQSNLPDYMIPTAWVSLEALPLTPNGKVDRRSLPLPDQDQLIGAEYVAPVSEIEKALAGIWSELLGVEQVGLHDDFFALGGHSLKAVQVVSRVQSQLSFDVSLRMLFERPTIGELAQEIESFESLLNEEQPRDLGDGQAEIML